MKKLTYITTFVILFVIVSSSFVEARVNAVRTTLPPVTITISPLTTTVAVTTTVKPTPSIESSACLTLIDSRVTKIKSQASTWITERITSLTSRITELEANKKLMSNSNSATQAQTLITALQNDVTDLTNLNTQIQAYTAPTTCSPTTIISTLLPLVKDIFTQYRIYAEELPYSGLESYVLILQNLVVQGTTISTNLANDITLAQNNGVSQADITKLQNDAKTFNINLTTISNDITSLTNVTSTIAPSAYPGNVTQIQNAKQSIASIHSDVSALKNDYQQFVKDFTAAYGLGKTTTTATATPTPTM
jgi:hypothetical protein